MVVVLAAAACSRPALPAFPVGLYSVDTPDDVRLARAAGFDAFQSYRTSPEELKALAQAAHREGMTMLIYPDALMASSVSSRGWPVAAWYVIDEPEVARVSPAVVAAHEKAVRAWAPGQPTTFVVGTGSEAAAYAATGDALMVDWYPVPHLPLESVGANVRAVAAVAGTRPTWAVVQAMDWRNFEQGDPKKPRIGRFPDRAEMRFMSYDAVLAGARGLWYFCFRPKDDGHTLAEQPAEWLAVTDVVREMAAMAPVFGRGRPLPPPFAADPAGPVARAWTYHGRDYLVMENPHRERLVKVPAEALSAGWRPLFDVRRDPRELLMSSDGAPYMLPYQVLVLESRLKLGRLLGR